MESNSPNPPSGPPAANRPDSDAPHPLLQALHSEAEAARGGAPASPLRDGLRVLGVVIAVELLLSLALGAVSAQHMEALLHHRGEDLWLPAALQQLVLGGMRVLLFGAGVASLYALSLVARASSEVRSRLYIALAAGGIDLLLSLLFLVIDLAPFRREFADLDSLMSLRMTLGGLMSLADVIGSVALFESLLSLRGPAGAQPRALEDNQARVLFWVLLIGRYAMAYAPAMTGPLWRETSQWLWFGVRSLLRVGGAALLLALLREAMEQALSGAAAAGSASPAPVGEGADSEALRSQGARNLFFGILWCVGGLAVTLWSYQSAHASRGGGRYVIVYGAIIAGIAQAIRGLIQLGRAR